MPVIVGERPAPYRLDVSDKLTEPRTQEPIMMGKLAIISAILMTLTSAASAACVDLQPRNDGGSSGYFLVNNCGRPVTLVVEGDGELDYRNLNPGQRVNWTTSVFDRYKVCNGFSNISC